MPMPLVSGKRIVVAPSSSWRKLISLRASSLRALYSMPA
jgi:hypothetical protein